MDIRYLSPHSPTSRSHSTSLTHSMRTACRSVQSPTPTAHDHANSTSVRTNSTYQIQKEELHAYECHLCSCKCYSPILQTEFRSYLRRLLNTARTE
ncbi:Hypothetical predicted protein, partial [Pelobates cultripes]